MKAIILAGGYGTRISEESGVRPKPMVEIGNQPILWHIMKLYSHYGINDFVICAGYKAEVIKEYFSNYLLRKADVIFDTSTDDMKVVNNNVEKWKVAVIDTGEKTMTGGRLKRVRDYIGSETFLMTYGDGVGDVNIKNLTDFHKKEGVLATVTAVQSPGRFGTFKLDKGQTKVADFREKPADDDIKINGGFFVLEPQVLNYIEGDETIWERGPMERLEREGQLAGYRHNGFWHPLDTLHDKMVLNEMWLMGKAPWKIWDEKN